MTIHFLQSIRRGSLLIAAGFFAMFGVIFFFSNTSFAATDLLNESFTGSSTVPGQWTYGGNGICLTAGDSTTPAGSVPACGATALDAAGSGVLRLTANAGGQAGFVILNTPLNAQQGFRVAFDMYQYSMSARPADGIGFMLIDGSYSPTTHGGSGGSLGYGRNVYRQDTNTTGYSGILGGYAGVGFDVYGNFSATSCAGASVGPGCTGYRANGIGIRGSAANQYRLVESVSASGPMHVATNNRADAVRSVVVSVSPTQLMTVSVDYHDGNGPIVELNGVDLTLINGAGAYPSTLKMGFSGSTGGYTDYHEIRNLAIQTLDPDLSIALSSDQVALAEGSTGTITAVVSNASSAASTSGVITSTVTLPDGLVLQSASGAGWSCTITGQTVSCTRPGSGADALQAGASASPITIVAKTLAGSLGVKNVTGSVSTVFDVNVANDQTSLDMAVIKPNEVSPSTPSAPNTGVASTSGLTLPAAATVVASLLLTLCAHYGLLRRFRLHR